MRACALALVAALLSPGAQAADANVVGTTILGGKRVELLSDHSWRFAEFSEADGKNCVPINQMLAFCGSIFDWRPVGTTGTDFLRQFRHSDRAYAGIIFEELGANDGMDMEFMRNVIIENVAIATSVPAQDVPIHEVQDSTVDGHPAETIVYGAAFNGVEFLYQNTLVNGPNNNLQFVVWSIGGSLTDEIRALNENFLASIRLTLPEAAE